MKTIYALLVGIDEYPPAVPKLSGSKKDVIKIKKYLEEQFSDRPLHIKTLLDDEASYEQLVEQFRTHLGKAGPDDVVWFHYSGHGSRQFSAPEFVQLNSGKKDETLVLHDSRPAGLDLADKEIAVLLNEISKNKPHTLVTLDCCHSGSGTRSVDDYVTRLSVDRGDIRTLDTYMKGYYERSIVVPEAQYILFAACNRFQSAKETWSGGGLFTDILIKTLSENNKEMSYAELLIKLRQAVVAMDWNQDPQLEIYGELSSYTQFLDGTPVPNAPKFEVVHTEEGWKMGAGQILGISEEVNLVIFPDHSNDIITKASVSTTSAQHSFIVPKKDLDPETIYWAVPINLPLPFEVGLQVEQQFIKNFEAEAAKVANVGYTVLQSDHSPFEIIQQNENFELRDKRKDQVIFYAKVSEPLAMAWLTEKLRHIAAWTRIFSLQNNNTILSESDCLITLEIQHTEGAKSYTPGEINIKANNQKFPFKIWVQNQFTQPLNILLIYLSDHYQVIALKNEPLEKSDSPNLFWGGDKEDYFMLPNDTKLSNDNFLIIISTERTDDIYFDLEALEFGKLMGQRAIPGIKKRKIKGEWFSAKFEVNLSDA